MRNQIQVIQTKSTHPLKISTIISSTSNHPKNSESRNLPSPLQQTFSLSPPTNPHKTHTYEANIHSSQKRRSVSLGSSRDTQHGWLVEALQHPRAPTNVAGSSARLVSPPLLPPPQRPSTTIATTTTTTVDGVSTTTLSEQRRSPRGEGPRGFCARSQLAEMSRARWGSRCSFPR